MPYWPTRFQDELRKRKRQLRDKLFEEELEEAEEIEVPVAKRFKASVCKTDIYR